MQIASLTIAQLEERFFLEKAPYWWAYHASRAKDKIGQFREGEEYASDEEKLLDAWMQLEELFKTIEYGRAKVVMKTSQNATSGITLTVQWGQAPARPGRPGIGTTSHAPAAAQNNNMLLYMLEMQKEANAREAQAREAAHAREMETMRALLETKFRAENLEAEIEGMGEPSMSEELMRGFIDIAKTMVGRPALPPPAAALGTLGQGDSEPIAPPPPRDSDPGNPDPPGQRKFSVDLALQHIAVIRKNMPEYHINDILHGLALFTEHQTDQAKTYLGMMLQSVSHEG
ncbi:MAG: hypothetical protein AAGA31_04275 [Bacteroidota bacterium]